MGLRRKEERILAEMERRLVEDDPDLAGRLSSFGADDPAFAFVESASARLVWIVSVSVLVVVVGLLVVLLVLTPGASAPEPAGGSGGSGAETSQAREG
ncbi:DUF3040 domain-containing protein [Nocardiopsis sp. CNT-189]|uniref:DUF3040 domain-containing protein n=1 Tax=Nocardiopsis oceanisediminis TaxID=2816862 RepID=UPI003B2F0319